ncbi:MAG: chemotaxis protein CheC [Anaerolineales bacterium]|nr:chemotaxis protein CheC [Anaerolineales bacterium]
MIAEGILTAQFFNVLNRMAEEGFQHAADGLEEMVGKPLRFHEPKTELVELLRLPEALGGLEKEAVGIYLMAEGDFHGQIMFILPIEKGLEMADMVLQRDPGTTTVLGSLERSALAEVGNLTGSFFLSTIERITSLSTRPSPPAVIVDMVGAILNIVIAGSAMAADYGIIFETALEIGNQTTEAKFWVIPDTDVLELFNEWSIQEYG